MYQLKIVIFLFLLLFCTTELYALDSNEVTIKKQRACFSLDGIGNSFSGTVNGIGVSRQEKWHRLKDLVKGDIQVFSCMQENT